MTIRTSGILYGGPGPDQDGYPRGILPQASAHNVPGPVTPPFEQALFYPQVSFACAVSHTPWHSERVKAMGGIRAAIKTVHMPYTEVTLRAPNWEWSRIMWEWGASQLATHLVFLQDDIEVAPDFWAIVRAMVTAHPTRVFSLISNHPLAKRALDSGRHFYQCGELLGTGYVMPTVLLGAFLEHRRTLTEAERRDCEDWQTTRWLARTGRRALHPIPAPIQTLPGIETTNPAISYPYRKAAIDWRSLTTWGGDFTSREWWEGGDYPDYGATVANDTRLPPGPFSNREIEAGV